LSRHPVTVGVDLGGTSIRLGLYSADWRLLASHTTATRVAVGPQAVVDEIADCLRELLQAQTGEGAVYEPIGIGIGSPGPINLNAGVLGLLPNFPGWDNFPLRDALERATGLPVTLESDANAAALAEWKLGAGRATGLQSMAMITLGTGVGSGIILDGKAWHGMYGMGGEVGHGTVNPDGPLCGCGSYGCLEVYGSATGLVRLARGIAASDSATWELRALAESPDGFTARDVAALAEAGDPSAQQAFNRLGYYLGIGIANLTNTLDLPMVVVGGGLASAWDLFAPALFESVRRFSVVYRLTEPSQRAELEHNHTYIRPAMLGPSAGLLGAGILPWLQGAPAEELSASGLRAEA
jgi:glucokinase